jgi:hypothetical protein
MFWANKALPFGEESALFEVTLQKRLPPTGGGRESEPALPPLVLLLCAENEIQLTGRGTLGFHGERIYLPRASMPFLLVYKCSVKLLSGQEQRKTVCFRKSAEHVVYPVELRA